MARLLIALLILAPLCCYLEWGGGQSGFLFEMEWDILRTKSGDVETMAHPFVWMPMLGQLMFVLALFFKRHSRILAYMGIGLTAPLVLMILLVGGLALNLKIVASTLPFLLLSVWLLRIRKQLPSGDDGPKDEAF